MKHLKKGISILLSALLLCSFGIIAFAEDHVHHYTAATVYATCTEQGYTLFVCDCGDSYKDCYVNALGHNYGGWDAVQQATCTQEGVYERICSRCGSAQTQTKPVLDHYDGNKDGKCDTCDAAVEDETVYSPFDWFIDLFKTIFNKIREFFSSFSR